MFHFKLSLEAWRISVVDCSAMFFCYICFQGLCVFLTLHCFCICSVFAVVFVLYYAFLNWQHLKLQHVSPNGYVLALCGAFVSSQQTCTHLRSWEHSPAVSLTLLRMLRRYFSLAFSSCSTSNRADEFRFCGFFRLSISAERCWISRSWQKYIIFFRFSVTYTFRTSINLEIIKKKNTPYITPKLA